MARFGVNRRGLWPDSQAKPSSGGGGGGVASVTAGDGTVTVGGTGTNPTVKVTSGTFDASGAAATAQTNAQTFATAAVATETTRAEAAEAALGSQPQPTITGGLPQPYNLILNEDFPTNAAWSSNRGLNPAVWRVIDNVSGQNGVTALASNVSVSGSNLIMQLSDSTHGAAIDSGAFSNSASADSQIAFPVGAIAEFKVNMPYVGGNFVNWGGGWLATNDFSSGSGSYCELDCIECNSGVPSVNYHDDAGQLGPTTVSVTGNAMHTVTVLRGASLITFWIDGTQVGTFVPADTKQCTLRLAFTWGNGNGNTFQAGSSGEFLCDYVRVWLPADMGLPTTAMNPILRSFGINNATTLPSSRFARWYDYTLAGNTTIDPPANWTSGTPAPNVGDHWGVIIRQGATGFTATLSSSFKLISGSSTIPNTANTVSQVDFVYDGTNWRQDTPVTTTPA